MAIKRRIVELYRALPSGIRNAIGNAPLANNLRRRLFESDATLHDQFYTEDYYESEVECFLGGMPHCIFELMNGRFHPTSVIDVGCGTGHYLQEFVAAGVEGHGVDLAAASIKRCRSKGLDVVTLNLAAVPKLPWTADLVYSFEVAEHLPSTVAAGFVEALTRSARLGVVISAAHPGQPGMCHLNCRDKPYWIELFRRCGFAFDGATSLAWRFGLTAACGENWMFDNLMVFQPAVAGATKNPMPPTVLT